VSVRFAGSAILVIMALTLFCAKCSENEKSEMELGERALVLIFNPSDGKSVFKAEVDAEIAKTEEQRERGLMYRKELGENEGMLFIMPYSGHHKFWMKNTLLSLDMIFIGEDMKIKGIIKNTIPESTDPLGISEPSRYVLEVNAGFSDNHGISKGDSVKFIPLSPEGN